MLTKKILKFLLLVSINFYFIPNSFAITPYLFVQETADEATEALNNENNFEKNQIIYQSINTNKMLIEKVASGEIVNVTDWKNKPERTQGEIKGAELYLTSQKFDGGNSDNKEALKEIEELMTQEKFIEAQDLVMQHYKDDEIRRSTMKDYIDIRIPIAFDLKDNIYFQIPHTE